MRKEDATPLTGEILRNLIVYNSRTGVFRWLKRPVKPGSGYNTFNSLFAGRVAGTTLSLPNHNTDYIQIKVLGPGYAAHRLAFLYVTDSWPTLGIDHKDGDGTNNRWSNLREATRSQNGANSKLYSNNKTGFKGVTCRRGGYRAIICINGKIKHLGDFENPQDAGDAYRRAAQRHFKEFAKC